jgi:hypothetical protein
MPTGNESYYIPKHSLLDVMRTFPPYAPSVQSFSSLEILVHACAIKGAAMALACTLAAVTLSAMSHPIVSTTELRFRPLPFLAAWNLLSLPYGQA